MHAVVIAVTIEDVDTATRVLNEEIVPQVKQAPGFHAGWWVTIKDGAEGRGTMVFESEEVARGVAEQIGQEPGEAVTIQSVDVGEVAANA
jgi:hypothetical protein